MESEQTRLSNLYSEPGLEGTPIGREEKEERRGSSLLGPGPGEGSKHLTAVW